MVDNINLGVVGNQLLGCGDSPLPNTVKYSGLAIGVDVVWVRASLDQNVNDFIVTLSNCVKEGKLQQSVLNCRVNTLFKEKSNESSSLNFVFECACLKESCLLVVLSVVTQVL